MKEGPFIVCFTWPGDSSVPPTIATAPTTEAGPLQAARSSFFATPFWNETAIRTASRMCARESSASCVAGVFVSRTTISAGSIRSGRQSARSGTRQRSPNESIVTAPLSWIARACASRARSCTSRPARASAAP